jgi:hypothetical protein
LALIECGFLHTFLWKLQCAFWQVELQYLVILQQPQVNLALVYEQNAHDGAAEDMFLFLFLLTFFEIRISNRGTRRLVSQVIVNQVVILLVDLRGSQRVSAWVSGEPAKKRFYYLQEKVECRLCRFNKFDD